MCTSFSTISGMDNFWYSFSGAEILIKKTLKFKHKPTFRILIFGIKSHWNFPIKVFDKYPFSDVLTQPSLVSNKLYFWINWYDYIELYIKLTFCKSVKYFLFTLYYVSFCNSYDTVCMEIFKTSLVCRNWSIKHDDSPWYSVSDVNHQN